ncbi:brachyurin-like [Ctenocephalides felis]|uniref:brachyurin-like n=1 Tax=Ctenocephalides felis TaxID=7515 RepID=UPI000E6E4705|nr:brachyurin-like [Ctenocephalides felis]
MNPAVIVSFVLACAFSVQAHPSSRIVNGLEAGVGQFPIQVFLDLTNIRNEKSRCGGALLSDSWVLTAAHCFDDLKSMVVSVGAHDISKSEEPHRQTRKPERYFQHEKYDKANLAYDLGLLKLDKPVELNDFVKLTKLNKDKTETFVGKTATVSGWGISKDFPAFELPDKLQYTTLEVQPSEDCKKVWGPYMRDYILCAKFEKQNICMGDSGGPLTIDGVQVGVVSFGSVPCARGNPSGFTNVAHFVDWIQEHTGLEL